MQIKKLPKYIIYKQYKTGKKANIGKLEQNKSKENDIDLFKEVYEYGIKYGYRITCDFYNIGKSTYYNYCKRHLRQYKFKSQRPNKLRKPNWDIRVVEYIKELRGLYANLGKSKLKPYMDIFCKTHNIPTISTGTIQNIINSCKNKLRTVGSKRVVKHRQDVIRKPKHYKAKAPGECNSLDSMEFRNGAQKAYVVVCLDEVSKLLYAQGTYSHSSSAVTRIFKDAEDYLPFDNLQIVLTDNGSEFMKRFDDYIDSKGITHYHTYPKTPKQNACCERVNRTIQDEFMIKYHDLLFTDLVAFNNKLKTYLHWYNFERVHAAFNNKLSPINMYRNFTNNGVV